MTVCGLLSSESLVNNSEMSVSIHQTKRRNIREDGHVHTRRHEKIRLTEVVLYIS